MKTENAARSSAPASRPSRALFAALLAATLLLSMLPRWDQYATYAAGAATAASAEDVSTPPASADSFYWFRLARAVQSGVDLDGVDALRHFPDGTPYERVPAISLVIAGLADLLGVDVYRAGLLLSILLSSLFVIPLALFGWFSGHPAAGLLGALMASFSSAFFTRSHLFRVDTDGGNLFFVWWIALGMLFVRPQSSPRHQAWAAAFSGLGVALFCFWYAQPGFWLVYLATFGLIVASLGRSWRQALGLLALFIVCSNPFNLGASFESLRLFVFDYLLAAQDVAPAMNGALVFPDVTAEIQEIGRIPIVESQRAILNPPILALVGLAGFVAFLATSWRRALVLLPILMLAGLGFLWASRMLMYAAPLAGFGLGYLASLGANAFCRRIPPLRASGRGPELLAYALSLALLLATIGHSAFDRRPTPSVDSELVASLQAVRRVLPPNAVIASTWSYGYAITDLTDAATFDDGRDPDDRVQQLLARGWTSENPEQLADILRFLASAGRAELAALADSSATYPELLRGISERANRDPIETARVHVLFLEPMLQREFSAYYYKGFWDFEKQQSSYDGFEVSRCRRKAEEIFRCASKSGRYEVDLETGLVNGQPLLRRVVRTQDGEVVEERSHNEKAAVSFESLEGSDADTLTGLLVREPVYRSNFNQMFVLGRIDPELFSERLNAFPEARLFEFVDAAR
jgi:hypothetical protein